MRFFTATFATLAILAAPVLAAPNPLRAVETYSGSTTGKYIVKFKAGVSRKQWVKKLGLAKAVDWESLNGIAGRCGSSLVLRQKLTFFVGLPTGNLNTDALNILRASADVEYVSEDGIMYTQAVQYVPSVTTNPCSLLTILLSLCREDATWGLQRISSVGKITNTSTP